MTKTIPALAALLAAASVGLGAAGAHAADLTLGSEGLLDLARSGQPLCGGWRAKDGSCEDIGFLDVVAADQVRQTYRFRLSMEPDYEVVMQETSTIENGALCSVFDFDRLDITVLLDGKPAPGEQAVVISSLLEESVAEYRGKKTCETFLRDSVTGELTTQVTVDGERTPSLESIYRVLTPEDRIHLRAPDEGPDPMRLDV